MTTLIPAPASKGGKAKGKGKKKGIQADSTSSRITQKGGSLQSRRQQSTPTKSTCAAAGAAPTDAGGDDSDDELQLSEDGLEGDDLSDGDGASGVTAVSGKARLPSLAAKKATMSMTKDEALTEKWIQKLNFKSIMKSGKLGRTVNQALPQEFNCGMFLHRNQAMLIGQTQLETTPKDQNESYIKTETQLQRLTISTTTDLTSPPSLIVCDIAVFDPPPDAAVGRSHWGPGLPSAFGRTWGRGVGLSLLLQLLVRRLAAPLGPWAAFGQGQIEGPTS